MSGGPSGVDWSAVEGFARDTLATVSARAGTSCSAVWHARRAMLVAPGETAGLLSVCHCAGVDPPPRTATGEAVVDTMERRRLAKALNCGTWTEDTAQAWTERLLTEEWT
jgi:hypothetical protein